MNETLYTIEEGIAAYQEHGSMRAAARALGVAESGYRKRMKKHLAQGDPAIAASMRAVGTGMVPALTWAKTKPGEDGLSYSVLLKPEPVPDDLLYRIREAFEGMEPAPPVDPPENALEDYCNVIPLFDVHFGMHAWGKETGGQDYDTKLAASDLRQSIEKVLALTPHAAHGIIIIGGDFFHADDNRNETPANRHKLDVDGRHQKVIASSIETLSLLIGRVQSRHTKTTICILRGNHDEHSHLVLKFALAERYRMNSRVEVDVTPRDLFMAQWGRAAIFAHHGDKAPPERLTLYVSDICPFWSETRHRHFYTGHIHKDQARDIGPLRWESLRAFCPPDSYAAGMGYAGRRAIRVDTYHKRDGRVLTAIDPIERLDT